MKKKIFICISLCVFLTGCSSGKAPELLEPVGEQTDSAKVTRGEMYSIASYDSALTSKTVTVKMPSDGVVKNVNVQIGDKVNVGDSLITLDGDTVSSQIHTIDDEIAEKRADNEYINQLAEYDIQIAELELKKVRQTSDSSEDVNRKEGELRKLENKLEEDKVTQEKELAELQLDKVVGSTNGGELTAAAGGTIVYLNTGEAGSILSAGTVVALIAVDDSDQLLGTYIEADKLSGADKVYARIGDKEYNVTNVPYDPMELAQRIFLKQKLYSTFYVEDAPELQVGMYASIVVISDYLEDALQIPDNALYSDVDGYYVYKLENGEYVRKDVKTGQKTETMVQITEGLEEGDEVYVKP